MKRLARELRRHGLAIEEKNHQIVVSCANPHGSITLRSGISRKPKNLSDSQIRLGRKIIDLTDYTLNEFTGTIACESGSCHIV